MPYVDNELLTPKKYERVRRKLSAGKIRKGLFLLPIPNRLSPYT
jgi:hypothetical protein